jgi:hypothetical protein
MSLAFFKESDLLAINIYLQLKEKSPTIDSTDYCYTAILPNYPKSTLLPESTPTFIRMVRLKANSPHRCLLHAVRVGPAGASEGRHLIGGVRLRISI